MTEKTWKTCKITGCEGVVKAHGLCAKHYMRQRRHGDPSVTVTPGPKPDPNRARLFEQARYDLTARKGEPFPVSDRPTQRYYTALVVAAAWLGDNLTKEIYGMSVGPGGTFSAAAFERNVDVAVRIVAQHGKSLGTQPLPGEER